MIPVKRPLEIESMRKAGRIAANILDSLCQMVEPGINTYDLDQAGRRLMAEFGVKSACYGYGKPSNPFPAYTCISVNDAVVHGIGDLRCILEPGDVVSVDVSIVCEGWIGDNARTVAVGDVAPDVERLLVESEKALYLAIDQARPGNRVGFISNTVETHLNGQRLGIVRDFVGHGVGRTMHEPPQIPNFGPRKRGDRLGPGMTLAIEPMVTLGSSRTRTDDDGWTARTADGSPSAHFEHTVLVCRGTPEILTIPDRWRESGFPKQAEVFVGNA